MIVCKLSPIISRHDLKSSEYGPNMKWTKKAFSLPHHFDLYVPNDREKHPLICITPLLGRLVMLEDLFLERIFARYFASHGFTTALVHRPIFEFDPSEGLQQIAVYLDTCVRRNHEILDYLMDHTSVNPKRIGSFGMSFGSIVNCLWGANDPRVGTHALALAGGDLPDIFIKSRDPLMRSYFRGALQKVGGDPLRLRKSLIKLFTHEPLEAAGRLHGRNILMALAVFDRVVPFQNGMRLRQALGKPKTLFLPCGHYSTILGTPILKRIVLKFFREKLK